MWILLTMKNKQYNFKHARRFSDILRYINKYKCKKLDDYHYINYDYDEEYIIHFSEEIYGSKEKKSI